MEYRSITIETNGGSKVAIVNREEDGADLDVSFLILYDRIEELGREVDKLRGDKDIKGILPSWIPWLVSKGLLIKPLPKL